MRIRVPLAEKEESCALNAAAWVGRFHPGVTAVVHQDIVELEYNGADEGQLVRIWNAALLNERSLQESGPTRRELLKRLTQ